MADAAAFAAVYGKNGEVLGVLRLNSITHKPEDKLEGERIKKAGGSVWNNRVNGILAVSRAIGDAELKDAGVCSEATIDITNVDAIASQLKISRESVGKIQVISTCDGFTDGTDEQTKEGHEQYLLAKLKKIASPGTQSEEELSKLLVEAAKRDRSHDNISVAVQSITKETPAFLLGLYDGHGGSSASVYAAENIGETFTHQCTLSPAAYNQQKLSVNKNKIVYKRDNPNSFEYEKEKEKRFRGIVEKLQQLTQEYQNNLDDKKAVTEQIKPVLDILKTILDDEKRTAEAKVKGFYLCLDEPLNPDDKASPKNIDVIKQDKSISAKNYLAGIAMILVTLATAILPGLIISGIVYAATGRSPLDLFNTKGQQFAKELDLVKRQHHYFKGTFFEPPRAESKDKVENEELTYGAKAQ